MADESVEQRRNAAAVMVRHHSNLGRHHSSSSSNSSLSRTAWQGQLMLTWSRVMAATHTTPSPSSTSTGAGADSVGVTVVVPPPRSGAASVVVQGRLYVFGGYGGGTGRLDDFWSYHFESGVWEEVPVRSPEKPGCRENNGVVISDSSRSIYLFGGYNGTNLEWKRTVPFLLSITVAHHYGRPMFIYILFQ